MYCSNAWFDFLQGKEESDRFQIIQFLCFISYTSGDINIIEELLQQALSVKDNDVEREKYIREVAFFVELNANKMVWLVDTSVKVRTIILYVCMVDICLE